jgi:ligand-binding SRPBCC domain-containing protein
MSVHLLDREQLIARPRQEVFAFFADAHNLEALTPPWLHFGVRTPRPIAMEAGTLIAYRMRLHGVPVRWLTRIEEWQPGEHFVDRQLRGPYRLWHHTHTFEDAAAGTLMRDRVRYALPLGPLGKAAHAALVRRDLARIFDFRRDAVAGLLSDPPAGDHGSAQPPV